MNIEIRDVILKKSYNDFDEPYFSNKVCFINEEPDEISDIECEVYASKDKFGDFEIRISKISALDKSGAIDKEISLSKEDRLLLKNEICNHIFFM
jgi:hypothetical protein